MAVSNRSDSDDEHPAPGRRRSRRVVRRRQQVSGEADLRDVGHDVEDDPLRRHERGGTRGPEGAEYCYRHGGHELVLSVRDLTERQAEAVARGEAEFALVVEGPLLVLGYRFGAAIPWAATAPFHWQWLPPEERVIPPEVALTPETFARLWGTLRITLVEADTGRVRARRAVALSPPFTCALLAALRAQATQPSPSPYARHALDWLSRTPEALPLRADCLTRCAGCGATPAERPAQATDRNPRPRPASRRGTPSRSAPGRPAARAVTPGRGKPSTEADGS